MDRRNFLQSASTVTAASLATVTAFAGDDSLPSATPGLGPARQTGGSWFDPSRTWHFFDLWHFDHFDHLSLRQGRAQWQRDATFITPPIGNLAAWPTVYRDEPSRSWRMLYSADWKPYQLMMAESDDGRNWHPLAQQDVLPEGGKIAPHHLFTLPNGSGGAVYLDPVADDGFPFKVFVHCQGEPAYQRAYATPITAGTNWPNASVRNGTSTTNSRWFRATLSIGSLGSIYRGRCPTGILNRQSLVSTTASPGSTR